MTVTLYQGERERLHELDALRGVAALVVVFTHYHDLLMSAAQRALMPHLYMAFIYLAAPLYAGQSAVVLFFVLSGFVLSLPYLEGKQQTYLIFALRRVIRIYLPYLAALAIAVLGDSLLHGRIQQGEWLIPPWSSAPTAAHIWQHVLFLGSYDMFAFNMVFWSLVIEMRVSLVFPLLAALVRTSLKTQFLATMCLLIVSTVLCLRYESSALLLTFRFGCYFLVGILLARARRQIREIYRSLSSRTRLCFVFMSFICSGYAVALRSKPSLIEFVSLLGATGAIILSLQEGKWRSFLRRDTPQFLGQISYSLYLVHIPVLFGCFVLLHSHSSSKLLLLLVYVLSALLAATLFFQIVEKPCLLLSRRIAKLANLPVKRAMQRAKP